MAELRSREFSVPMPYLFLDATYVKCRRDNRVQSTALVTAIAVGADGVRRVVGLSAIDTETYAGWLGFCRDLRKRGVSGVRCVTSDAHEGPRRAIAECFPGAAWQRCIAHLERDACSLLRSKRHRRAAGGIMQAVFAESESASVRAAYHAAIDAIGGFSGEAAELLEEAEADALAYLDFPAEHRRRIRTNNVQERTNREIKRRTRAVQVFPSMESMIRLVGAVMAEADEDWSTRRCMATMDALEREAPPEPAIDAETRLRAERLVMVAMESAGVAPRLPSPCYDTRILGKGPNLSGPEPPFARAAFGATSLERLTPTSATLPLNAYGTILFKSGIFFIRRTNKTHTSQITIGPMVLNKIEFIGTWAMQKRKSRSTN